MPIQLTQMKQILVIPALASLLAGCPWLNKSSSEGAEGEEEVPSLSMMFTTQCTSSTCYINTAATYDTQSDIAQVVCDMGDGQRINVNTLEINFDYTYAAPGTYDVTCVVTNIDGLTDSTSLSVLVTGLFASAGPDRVVTEGQTIVLDGSGSVDASGNGITYSWGKVTGLTGFYLNDSTVESPVFTAPQVDQTTVFIYSLTVDNGIEDSVRDTVSITVIDTADTDLPQ